MEAKLEVWERRVLRKILGGVEDGEWRRRTNKEVQEVYGDLSITAFIRAQRVRWLGHISRMPDNRHAKRMLEEGTGGKKKKGRPKKRWLDAVVADVKSAGVEDWKSSARDRDRWRRVVSKVKEM